MKEPLNLEIVSIFKHNILERILYFVRRHQLLLLFLLIETLFFSLNFRVGSFYDFGDIPIIEAHPFQEFVKTFSMWQTGRGFGLEFGSESGWVVLLLFYSFLSWIGLGATQIALIGNYLLYIAPGLSAYVLASAIFYNHSMRNRIAFFAGILYVTSFGFYLMAIFPLIGNIWAGIVIPIILADILMIMRTGMKRYWLLLVLLGYINIVSFTGFANAVVPIGFALIYLAYYLVFESASRKKDLLRVAATLAISATLASPILVAIVHLGFFSPFTSNPFLLQYDYGVFQLNLQGLDFSSLFYSLRLIGQSVWNQVLFNGILYHTYYPLYTSNPIFILGSFLLPILAFASLLFRDNKNPMTYRRVLILLICSLLFLFLIKGVRPPLGSVFLYLMEHVSLFIIFTNPYDKVAAILTLCMTILAGYSFSRLSNAHTNRKFLVKLLVAVCIIALVLDSYPQISGQVFSSQGFFQIPSYYNQAVKFVDSNQTSFKILPIPQIGYDSCYNWGYCGIGMDGVSFSKPTIQYSYSGSDVYDSNMMNAVLSEVSFDTSTGVPILSWNQTASIFPNTVSNVSGINLDRVMYFAYLLKMSNVRMILLHNDSTGEPGNPLSSLDWQRYDRTLAAMLDLGLLQKTSDIGNLTVYTVQGDNPEIFASSSNAVYQTNNYANFLNSYYTDSSLHVFSSFFGYDPQITFVSTANTTYNILDTFNSTLGMPQVYAPLSADQYVNQVETELAALQKNMISNTGLINSYSDVRNELQQLPQGTYIDNIMKPGNFGVYMRLNSLHSMKNATAVLDVENVQFNISAAKAYGNDGWYYLGNVNLPKGLVLLNTTSSIPSTNLLLISNNPVSNIVQPSTSFRNIGSSGYVVSITNATGPFWLDFLQSFSTGWHLYPLSLSAVNQLNNPELIALTQKAYPGTQHFLLNGFANAWFINRSLLNSRDISVNKNGTWNIAFLLYFEPQSFFSLAVDASLLTGAFIVAAIVVMELKNPNTILRRFKR